MSLSIILSISSSAAWMKSAWSSAFVASLWLRTLGFAFVPSTKARGWNSFILPLDSEESLLGCLFAIMAAAAWRAKRLRTCVDLVLFLVLLLG
eukprot:1393991-Ditylum_brightwellii.AAC.1